MGISPHSSNKGCSLYVGQKLCSQGGRLNMKHQHLLFFKWVSILLWDEWFITNLKTMPIQWLTVLFGPVNWSCELFNPFNCIIADYAVICYFCKSPLCTFIFLKFQQGAHFPTAYKCWCIIASWKCVKCGKCFAHAYSQGSHNICKTNVPLTVIAGGSSFYPQLHIQLRGMVYGNDSYIRVRSAITMLPVSIFETCKTDSCVCFSVIAR